MQKQDIILLYKSIVEDNEKEFSKLIDTNRWYALSYGRFPLLSLIYMYNSKKILNKYKKRLLTIKNYIFVEELVDIYNKFREISKRCFRFYDNNTMVTPYDILLIKGDNVEFLKISKNKEFTEEEKKRFSNISVSQSLIRTKNSKGIVLSKRKLVGKRKIILTFSIIIFSFILVLSTVMGIFNIINSKDIKANGISVTNENLFYQVLKEENDYNFEIKKDFSITISKWKTINLSKNINGNGHKIYIKGDVTKLLFDTISSTIENITIVMEDNKVTSNLFNIIDIEGEIVNCNFVFKNIKAEFKDNLSLIVDENIGTIQNINIEVEGEFKATNEEADSDSESKYIQIVSHKNFGVINKVKIVEDISVTGKNFVNYTYASVCGINGIYRYDIINIIYGEISEIEIQNSKIDSFLIDVCGICCENYGNIKTLKIELDIKNDNDTSQWNPNVSACVLTNRYLVTDIEYKGTINIESNTQSGSIIVGSICVNNYNVIQNCISDAEINCNLKKDNSESNVIAGGVVAINYYYIKKTKFIGSLSANSINSSMNIGGICAINYSYNYRGVVDNCISECDIKATSINKVELYIGGIAGTSVYYVRNCISLTKFSTENNEKVFVGGIIGSLAKGDYTEEVINELFLDNNYLKINNLLGVCGYYEGDEHKKSSEEIKQFYGYEKNEDLKSLTNYWVEIEKESE